jgi:hypothetical protein
MDPLGCHHGTHKHHAGDFAVGKMHQFIGRVATPASEWLRCHGISEMMIAFLQKTPAKPSEAAADTTPSLHRVGFVSAFGFHFFRFMPRSRELFHQFAFFRNISVVSK